MAGKEANAVVRYIRRMAASGADRVEDWKLLDRFVTHRDEAAFEALLQRYGPLVWGMCRRILQSRDDADDAFQATFLVLVRKAASIGRRDQVGPWLYGVAYRIAVRARANAVKRRCHERQAPKNTPADPMTESDWRDLRPILDEEVQRLPEKYRIPFILCHLEGKTNDEAARQLGCPKGTIVSRLARARERLRGRLTRRGLALSVGGLAAFLTPKTTGAPLALMDSTMKIAVPMAAGQAVAPGVVSAPVVALIQGELTTMLISKFVTAITLLLGIGIGGAGVFSYRAVAPEAAADPRPAPHVAEFHKNRVTLSSSVEGLVMILGAEIKAGEEVPADQIFTRKVGTEEKKYRRLTKGDSVEAGQLLGFVDDRLARDDVAIREAKLKVAEADREAAYKTKEEAYARYLTQVNLYGGDGKGGKGNRKLITTSEEDLRAALLLSQTKHYEWVSKAEALKQAAAELRQAKTVLEMHELRSPARGVIKTILKHPGEAVKKLEPVLVIQLLDKRK
jgi:RNA polymerase sigma factor (sigma-70 family)